MKKALTFLVVSWLALTTVDAFAQKSREQSEHRTVEQLFSDAIPTEKTPSVTDKNGCLWVVYDLQPGKVELVQIKNKKGKQECRSAAAIRHETDRARFERLSRSQPKWP